MVLLGTRRAPPGQAAARGRFPIGGDSGFDDDTASRGSTGGPAPAPLSRRDGLTKRYGTTVTALDQLTLLVEPGHHRPDRGQRGRQVDADQDPPRAAGADQRQAAVLGHDCVTDGFAIRTLTGYMPEHDCLPPDVTATELVTHLGRMSGLPATAARERAADSLRHVGPVRGAVPADRHLLHRHEAARQAGPGARRRSAAAAAGRAHERPGSGRPDRDAGADRAHRRRLRHLDPRRLAPARRDRADLRSARRDRRRPAAAGRLDQLDDPGQRRAADRGRRGP